MGLRGRAGCFLWKVTASALRGPHHREAPGPLELQALETLLPQPPRRWLQPGTVVLEALQGDPARAPAPTQQHAAGSRGDPRSGCPRSPGMGIPDPGVQADGSGGKNGGSARPVCPAGSHTEPAPPQPWPLSEQELRLSVLSAARSTSPPQRPAAWAPSTWRGGAIKWAWLQGVVTRTGRGHGRDRAIGRAGVWVWPMGGAGRAGRRGRGPPRARAPLT